jgi:hypothetical protein
MSLTQGSTRVSVASVRGGRTALAPASAARERTR